MMDQSKFSARVPSADAKALWMQTIREAVRHFAGSGIAEAPPTTLFHWCPHVCVTVEGLAGIGVIHQPDPAKGFNFCVFEPSPRGKDGLVEIFERIMTSLDELPQHVEEWRSFRSATSKMGPASALQEHRTRLAAVARDKQKHLDEIRNSGDFRADGDIAAAWQAAGFDLKIARTLPSDIPNIAKEQLLGDLDAIAPDLLAWHMPRDEKGKWMLKRRVPLYRYDRDKRRMSAFCLLAAMPEKRSGRAEIRAEWLQADLQTARLDSLPELFDTRLAKDFTRELLGVDRPHAHDLWSQDPSIKTLAAQCLHLQHQGDFEKAAELAGIELDETILQCMLGRRVAHRCTCCAPLDRQLIEWSSVLQQTLAAMNLPRIGALALRDQDRIAFRPRKEPIPIAPFPLQRHIRKAHIALDIRNPARPRLTIETTGSGNRLPLPLWRRPEDVDLFREGLLAQADLPKAVALQWGI